MAELQNFCRICLKTKAASISIYLHVQQKYLPSVIENICGVVISSYDEPEALICVECAEAIIKANDIIQRCQESHKILTNQNRQLLQAMSESNEAIVGIGEQGLNTEECKKKVYLSAHKEETQSFLQPYFFEPEVLIESIHENPLQDQVPPQDQMESANKSFIIKDCKDNKILKRSSHLKAIKQSKEVISPEENSAALLYQSQFKTSKQRKTFVRSREQYLKRKIRNYPVKEPLKLIGEAGVIRKRKPKSHHLAIPNFYFRCELCNEFESNVASYAVTHLTTVHGIERPAIFRCSQCNAKPFIKNQSLQDHITTIHEQQPKKRDFLCSECGKTFIKNSHLQNHLLSVHKLGELPYKCKNSLCDKSYTNAYALRIHMKEIHDVDADKTLHTTESYNCLQCGYNFRYKARYEAHIQRAKCKPPCFVCRHCERTFVKLFQLEEHQRDVH